MRNRDAPQRGPGHLRELLAGEHGEASKAQDADADRVRCHEVLYWSSGSVHRTGRCFLVTVAAWSKKAGTTRSG